MTTLRGIATVNIWAADHSKAVSWYSELLKVKPYFERPGYAEFRVGDYETEVGIIDSSYAPYLAFPDKPAGAVIYWQVDDVQAMFSKLLTMNSTELEAPKDRGNGFTTATVVDPFGNMLGIMQNPHYQEVLKTAS